MTSPQFSSQDYLAQLRARRAGDTALASPGIPLTSDSAQPATSYQPAPVAAPTSFSYAQPPAAPAYHTETASPYPAQPVPSAAPQQPWAAQPDPAQTSATITSPASTPAATFNSPPITADDNLDELPVIAREEIILEWLAPSRPYKKRSARFYTTVGVIVILVCLILAFARQFVPIAVVVSVAFLSYVLAAIPPEQMQYQLTSYGIRIGTELYLWEELSQFWIETKYGHPVAKVGIDRFPFRLTIMLGEYSGDTMRSFLETVLPELQPEATYIERLANWLETHILLDEG